MEAGKTAAACAMISRMRHRGLTIDAFKATGVSLRRDILAFEDSGARRTAIFTDFGVVTTTAKNGPALTRTMLTEMATGKPDVIVFELGDGILGAYGVEAILDAPDIRKALTAVVLSANDPVAAWGGVKLLRERFDVEPAVVTGPATDNSVGVDIIREQLGVPAFNAMTNGAALGDCVIAAAGLEAVAHTRELTE
jgi:F0F1-type ATP synthase membrane subunit c/vacuolar-type H+-ATPase subunit K